ncbi:MAG: SNF2 helicase-associated domain-containing protein [Ilumatobacteraceae bacterium]
MSHTVDALHASAPLVCHRGEPDVTSDALGQLVDAMARQQLAEAGFAPPPPDADPTARLHHGVARALAAADPRIGRHPATEVRRLDVALHRARRRVDGLPVAVARLRLDPPDDPTEPWWVQLQLVDDDDPGRWCNAADVWQATPLAVDLAGRPDHLSVLADVARTAAHLLADELAQLASWSGEPEPDEIPLEVGEVSTFLDRAARRLARLDIDLIGPERLVHGTPRLHAVVDDAESDGEGPSRGRLGRQAVVEWSLVVDDGEGSHTLDDASLARAAAAGARLMHQGGRWIRLDPDTVQAATARLHTLRETRRRADPAGLLALAAESVGDGIAGGATATPDSTPISLEATHGWAMELLSGLGDDQLSEAVAPESFVGTLRPYQSRALVAATPRRHRRRRMPCRRHGSRQDRHHHRPPRRQAGSAPRRVSAQRRAQLATGVRPVRAVAADQDPSRRRARARPAGLAVLHHRRRCRHHDLRRAHARPRRAARSAVGHGRARRGAGGEELVHHRRPQRPRPRRRTEDRPHRNTRREPAHRSVGGARRREPGAPRIQASFPRGVRQPDRAPRRPPRGEPATGA